MYLKVLRSRSAPAANDFGTVVRYEGHLYSLLHVADYSIDVPEGSLESWSQTRMQKPTTSNWKGYAKGRSGMYGAFDQKEAWSHIR
jgi:hypothetical protein